MSAGKLALWIGGGLVALSILTTNVVVMVKVLSPQPTPVIPGPSPQQPLAALVTNAEHRAILSAFYRDFADVLSRDQDRVKTTGQFRTAHANAAHLLLQRTEYPKYPGLDQAVSDRIKGAIGLDDAPLDAPKRAALVACLTQISQELGG